jgi:chitinase
MFEIRNATTNKCFDLDAGSLADGGKLHQWDCNGGGNQKFYLVPQGSGHSIRPIASNKCFDLSGTGDGALLQQWSCNGGGNQLFALVRE